jgi:hypothetical protein
MLGQWREPLQTVVSDCPGEGTTQHHRGPGYGHGPVQSDEIVVFAVFEKTPRDGNQLVASAFPSNQLNRGEVSLVRLLYTTRATFDERVIRALEHTLGRCLGIARGSVATLRTMRFEIQGTVPTINGRAVCVLDKVTKDDYDVGIFRNAKGVD